MSLWNQYQFVEAYLETLQDTNCWQYVYLVDWINWCQYMWE